MKLILVLAFFSLSGFGQVFVPRNTARVYKGAGAPAAVDCNWTFHTGRVYVRQDAAGASGTLYVCANTGSGAFAWEGPYGRVGAQIVGAVLASAGTIAPTSTVHHVSGTAAIATITAPSGLTAGAQITLIPDGVFTTTTGGNISLASTAVVNKALIMTYDGVKFNPSY